MNFYYITFRSVTFAQRGEKTLTAGGIRCSLLRTPRWMEEQGCGYCLRLWTDNPAAAMELLIRNKIPMRKVYVQRSDAQLEEIKT